MILFQSDATLQLRTVYGMYDSDFVTTMIVERIVVAGVPATREESGPRDRLDTGTFLEIFAGARGGSTVDAKIYLLTIPLVEAWRTLDTLARASCLCTF